jgi:hypothetical protein
MLVENREVAFSNSGGALAMATDIFLLQQSIQRLDLSRALEFARSQTPEISRFFHEKAIPHLLKLHPATTDKVQQEITCFLRDVLQKERENSIVDLFLKMANSTELNLRLFAPTLIPLISSPARIRNSVFSLTLDRVPAVRTEALKSLHRSCLDQRTIDSIIRVAVKDKCDQVRSAAIEMIPDLAPHLVTEFGSLLQNGLTVDAALGVLPRFARVSGLTGLDQPLTVALKLRPDRFVSAYLFQVATLSLS